MNDFAEQLRRQLSFLESSCQLYDSGKVEEAVRIAVTLRVIFHNTIKSTSLLTHLGKQHVNLLSTSSPFADELYAQDIPSLYLVTLIASIPAFHCRAEPLLKNYFGGRSVVFHVWWKKELVIDLKEGKGAMNRRDLILAAANKDGGAHVDAILEPRYQQAKDGAGMSISFAFKDGRPDLECPFENIHYASLRQIGYEVLNSPALLAVAGK